MVSWVWLLSRFQSLNIEAGYRPVGTVVLRAEPDVALSVGGDIVVEVERVIADGVYILSIQR